MHSDPRSEKFTAGRCFKRLNRGSAKLLFGQCNRKEPSAISDQPSEGKSVSDPLNFKNLNGPCKMILRSSKAKAFGWAFC